MSATLQSVDLDIAECAREPIRVPGSIQPHGCLFAVDPQDMTILQFAVGDDDGLASIPEAGANLGAVLAHPGADLLSGVVKLNTSEVLQLGIVQGEAAQHHLLAHRSPDGNLIIELERSSAGGSHTFDDIFPNVRGFLEGLGRCSSAEELATLAAKEVRAITGLDRAMVYQFDDDWNGAVIAEDRNDRLPSYLDLRFPASDIPAQARDLYRLNRLRLIADANYRPQPITPEASPRTGQPLDLTFSVLRSVSPVHLEYMRNMGTMASMSISLLRGGSCGA